MLKTLNNFCLLALALSCATANAQQHSLIGTAVDLRTNQPLYTERHTFSTENGQTVMTSLYTNPQNETLAERTVAYDGDRVSRYQMAQPLIGHQESVARQAQTLTLFEKRQSNSRQKTIDVGDKDEVIIDAGFNNYVERNWHQLMSGETLKAHFASPARMGVVKLQIKRAAQKETAPNTAVFEMTAANPIIRLLIKPVEIGFYTNSRQLAYYKGVSNLRDKTNNFYQVKINFGENEPKLGPPLVIR